MEVIQPDDLESNKLFEEKSDPISINVINDTPPASPQLKPNQDNDDESDENEELIYRRLEAEISNVKSEVREKETEFQLLMKSIEKLGLKASQEADDENNKNRNTVPQEEYYTLEDIENMQALISEMQANLQIANAENEKHVKHITKLEQENMKLKEENLRLLQMSPKTICFSANERHEKKYSGDEDMLETSILPENLNLFKSSSETRDVVDNFHMKTEAIKDKLQYEQNRNRELEFIVVAQKSTIENLTNLLSRSEDEKKKIEKTSEKNRQNSFKINEKFLKTKSKLDNLLIYCKLMENCSYSKQEFMSKIAEIPPTIIAYIKGETEDFSIPRSKLAQSKLYKLASEYSGTSRRASPMKRKDLEIDIPEDKKEKNREQLRESMSTLSPDKMSRGQETNPQSIISSPLLKKDSVELAPSRKDSLNSSQIIKKDTTPSTTNSFISQAVKHSSSLIWNLRNSRTSMFES